tara:strand:- start:352 stop:525 length:174 start_codon:yes stop_codon:yes gene_type:complete
MAIITKTEGYFIINTAAIALDGTIVSHRDDASVQEFSSKDEMMAAHREQYPEQYPEH